MKTNIIIVSVISLIFAGCADGGFVDTPGKYMDILQDGKPVVRYMYEFNDSSVQTKHETYKVYHHVMNEEGSAPITKGPYGKFTHHRGLFIGWNHLQHAGAEHDLWHMKGKAVQLHKEFLIKKSNARQSILSSRIDWMETDGETVCLEEIRTVTVHHDDPDAFTVIDFQSELTAVNGDVELLGDPQHAGMQYRAHQDVAENVSAGYIFPNDTVNVKKHPDLPWVTLTYQLADGKEYTVQQMNHPDNPVGTLYSAYRDYGRFGAFFETKINDGETLTVKYRFRISSGKGVKREEMDEHYENI